MTTGTVSVPFFDYRAELEAHGREIRRAIHRVLKSGRLILGPEVEAFEREFAACLGGRGRAVAVGNGTDALAIALRALGVGPGDEVITVANTAIPTVSAIRMVGATPVFCDVDPSTSLLNVHRLERCVTPRTRVIMPVHLYGNAVDMDGVLAVARRHGLAVVEDCAQAMGTTWRGRLVGTFGEVGCFSFYPTKNLGAYGDGGLCYTSDAELAARMRKIRFYGCGHTYCAELEGVNSRLDEIQAAILRVKLRYLPEALAARRAIAARYERDLSRAVERTPPTEGAGHTYHLYVIKVPERNRVTRALREAGVGYAVHYPTPIHLMPAYRFLGCSAGTLPVTERLAEHILSLPCYPGLDLETVSRIAEVVNHACHEG